MTDLSDIAHFRILDVLGEGGMGIVYRAADRKLQRTVALKVLPPELTSDPTRRARVLTEARAAAAIDHPAIATVYEVGEHEGAVYIAMELLEGRTLLDRVRQDGPAPLAEALGIGIAVASALRVAHEAGVIHRDLKDDNIMIGPSGEIRIVDFGLAKMRGGPDLDALEEADTEQPASRKDVAVGTPGFMAPEQAKNHDVDGRADIFAFGVVLTRLTTGKLPFDGATPFELLIAPMHDEPELSDVPRDLQPIVARCLRPRRDERYADAAELAAELEAVRGALEPTRPPHRVPLVAATIVGVSVLTAGAWWSMTPPAASTTPTPSATVEAPATVATNLVLERVTTEATTAGATRGAISPDGRRVVFAHGGGLFLREIATGEQRQILDNANSRYQPLAWWRDDVVCATGGEAPSIVVQPLDGGPARPLANPGFTAAVSPDGERLALATEDGVRLWSPGGDGRLVVSLPRLDAQELGLVWNGSGDRLMILRPMRSEDGDSVRVETIPLDADGDASTEPTLALEDRALAGQTAYGAAVWLPDGRLVVSLTEPPPDNLSSNLWETVVDPKTGVASGPLRRLTRWPAAGLWYLTMDAKGERVLLSLYKPSITLMIAELAADGTLEGPPTPLPSDLSMHWPSGWLDDERVVYSSNRSGRLDVFAHRIGGAEHEPLLVTPHHDTYALRLGDDLLHFRAAWNEEANAVESRLLRTAPDGGETVLFEAPPEPARFTFGSASPIHTGVRCGADFERCVVGRKIGDRFVVRDLDGDTPRADLPAQGGLISWDLSPDGGVVTVMEARLHHATSSIAWFEADPHSPRRIELDRSCSPTGLDWVSRERAYLSCFDPGGHVLLRVDADGRTTLLHQAASNAEIWQPLSSPSAERLVYRQDAVSASLWLVEGW